MITCELRIPFPVLKIKAILNGIKHFHHELLRVVVDCVVSLSPLSMIVVVDFLLIEGF